MQSANAGNVFAALDQAPPDAILGITEQFKADPNPRKVNLGVGVYQDADGKLPLLACVDSAQRQIAERGAAKGYLPIDGIPDYASAVRALIFGTDSQLLADGRVVTCQALGGTGALKLGADLLHFANPAARVLISDPSWENHQALFTRAGFAVSTYRYYDAENRGVDFAGMLADLQAAEPGTIVILHACCHNPTGYDLTDEQWQQVLDVVEQGRLVAFIDMAYQGFSQDLHADSRVVRMFAQRLPNVLISSSFSKSMSLYGERVGALSVVCADADEAVRLRSQLKIVIRTNFSNPPTHGALLAASVLNDPALHAQWVEELGEMRDRIKQMRGLLLAGLEAAGAQGFGHIVQQVGMFSYSGLSREQMQTLRTDFGIYGTDKGRICLAALNQGNVDYVAQAIAQVVRA